MFSYRLFALATFYLLGCLSHLVGLGVFVLGGNANLFTVVVLLTIELYP